MVIIKKKKVRADKLLVDQGFAPTRQKAQALIMAGLVISGGRRVEKSGQLLDTEKEIVLLSTIPFVSRGGLKLEEGLRKWKIRVEGKIAVDLGASTGGFTDCLLQHGAAMVYAVDVDVKQLDCHLTKDPRVRRIEKNARNLNRADFAESPGILTADLSFISILKVLPAVREFLGRGDMLALIKPQFEVGKGRVGKKGIVRDPALHEETLGRVVDAASTLGFHLRGLLKCATRGQKGNQEFLAWWTLEEEPLNHEEIRAMIKEAVWDE